MTFSFIYNLTCCITEYNISQISHISLGPTTEFLTSIVDAKVDEQQLSSCKPGSHVTDIHPVPGIYANVTSNAVNMTPTQYNLLTNPQWMQCVVDAPAGGGKTLMIILKILELLRMHTSLPIYVVAPSPHHLRLANQLRENGAVVYLPSCFPPPPSSTADVFIYMRFRSTAMEKGCCHSQARRISAAGVICS